MKAKHVIDILTAAIPQEESWSRGELYGAYNVKYLSMEINRILYCVTPTEEVIRYFHENKYDLLISHHPFTCGENTPQLIFHTALDCCKGGLNDQWSDALNIKNPKHFDRNLGWYGEIEPTTLSALCFRVSKFMQAPILGQACSKIKEIRSVVVCTGLGGLVLDTALKTGADCYILGEATWDAKKSGFKAVIETGHTNSEWIGVNLIQQLLPGIQVDCVPKELDVFGNEYFRVK